MDLTRRDFLKASSAILTAFGVNSTGLFCNDSLALETEDGGMPVIWIQGQSCNGCSVSLLNAIYYAAVDDVLLSSIDLEFHPTLMSGAGHLAVSAAEKAYRRGGYILVVEGAIPTAADGKYCLLWPGLTMTEGVKRYAKRASFIMGVGACACYGGVVHGGPNPTGAKGLDEEYFGKRVIKIPCCPVHPDHIVGTIANMLETGTAPELDESGRPTEFFKDTVHKHCTHKEEHDNEEFATELGKQFGGLLNLGCKGKEAKDDCPTRRWNPGGPGERGVNWCVGAGSPCYGCSEPGFPDQMSPFYTLDPNKKGGE